MTFNSIQYHRYIQLKLPATWCCRRRGDLSQEIGIHHLLSNDFRFNPSSRWYTKMCLLCPVISLHSVTHNNITVLQLPLLTSTSARTFPNGNSIFVVAKILYFVHILWCISGKLSKYRVCCMTYIRNRYHHHGILLRQQSRDNCLREYLP